MKLKRFCVLSEAEIEAIHEASLRLLSEVGMRILSRSALDLLADGGLEVDTAAGMVKFPRKMVEEALRSVPASIALYDRNGKHALTLGEGERTHAASGHNAIYVLDYMSSQRRNATKADVAKFALLADALPNIDMVGVQAMPQDVPARSTLLHAVDAVFSHSTKPVYFSPEAPEVTCSIFDIVRAVMGSSDISIKPPVICQLSSTSPLTWEDGAVDSVIETAKAGVPCCFLPQPFSGVTSPITLAGTLALHNAEVLSGVVVSQLVRPGTPVIYGSAWTTFDMKEANVVIGSPETALLRIAGAQMARFYNMPSHTIAPDSDTHATDEQNAWERCLTALSAVAGGVDLIVNAGMFATGLTVSFEQLVIDDEILGWLGRYVRGIEISEDTIAFEVMKKIGPKGDFLTDEHTLKYLRSGEHWEPGLSIRCMYDQWMERGAQDVVKAAADKVERIVNSHRPAELTEEVKERVVEVIAQFESTA